VLSLPDEGVELSTGAAGVLATLGVSTTLDEGASEGVAASEGVEVVSDIQGLPISLDQQGVMPLCCVCVQRLSTRHGRDTL
jgi:hypothetical protein